ncbi:sensor histidine kinase [Paenibacillus sp. SGZ-1009]|uniref:sensor histidine kinase n=1 Tax=Paenibacillus campi TaxID=3106031 RepID=UPI002AFF075B|nr:ATP-binding protein [Paenibacillus sp. SGZ-1009]
MTIKHRLIISNILMIVVPVIISAIIIAAGQYMSLQYWKVKYPSDPSGYDVPDTLTSTALDLSHDTNNTLVQKRQKLESYLQTNHMRLTVYDYKSRRLLLNMGDQNIDSVNTMIAAIWALNGDGSIVLENSSLTSKKVTMGDKTYLISTFNEYTPLADNSYSTEYDSLITLFTVLFALGVLITIFFTNRFLTHFVFKHINQPLHMLIEGVQQIRDGNLDTRIRYHGKDEFAGVCHDFNDMAEKLKQSMQLIQRQENNRKELLASISHDLRSPLTSIRAYSEGLLDGVANTPEARHNYIQMIKTKAEDIDRMVAKIFLFSKMDMGDYPYDPELLDVNRELESLVRATIAEYADRGLDIQLELAAEPARIFADPLQLDSIFTNIMENSLKYRQHERGLLQIQTIVQREQIIIYLTDNGPGVPEQSLGHLFDVFYRSDPSRNNPNKGSGLGLAITAKAVERMGGSIKALHAPSGGLRIIIRLPLIVQEEQG